jgi:hypothetical protein
LDEELQRALAIDPSPEFLARVRTRIAAEREPRTWGFRWLALPGGVAALAALLIAAWITRGGTGTQNPIASAPAPAPDTRAAVSQPVPSIEASRAPEPTVPAPAASSGAGARAGGSLPSTARVALVNREPEVLFDPREQEGFRRLIAALNSGRVDRSTLKADGADATAPLDPIAELSVPPLPAVEPINTGGY